MANRSGYKGSVVLIAGITQKNNQTFPMVHADDVQIGDNEEDRLTAKLDELMAIAAAGL